MEIDEIPVSLRHRYRIDRDRSSIDFTSLQGDIQLGSCIAHYEEEKVRFPFSLSVVNVSTFREFPKRRSHPDLV